MKRKILFVLILFIIGISCLFVGNKAFASTDLDEIQEYIVTVDPRMTDGTLDITYEIKWKVLDSTTEGPLSWVTIGTPNQNFDTATGITSNIKSISKYNSSYVKIIFDRDYYAGEVINFKYSIHQSYMYEIDNNMVSYNFTPAWFTDAKVKKMSIRWNSDGVTKHNSGSQDGSYLVWNKSNMSKGEKLSISVKYNKSSFSALDANKQNSNVKKSSNGESSIILFIFILIIVIIFINIIFGGFGGYYGHRGFYRGGFYGGFYGGPRGPRPPRGRRMCS